MPGMGRIGDSGEMDTPPPNYPVKQHHTHGCSSLSFPQVASYLIIVCSLAIYWSCLVESAPLIWLILLEQVCLFGMVIGAGVATFSDPTDRVIYSYKWAQFDSNIKYNLKYEQVMYCEYCDSYCHKDSKHCRSCNRCVDGFDHHCIWFNNCVGQRNYRAFFMSIVCTFIYSCIFVGHTLYASLNEHYPSGLKRMIPAWIIGAVLALFAFLLANLIFLHLYLINKGETTYSFLTRQKKEEEQRAKQEALKDSNRSEGNLILQNKRKTTLNLRELQLVKVAGAKNNSRNEPTADNQIRVVELHQSQHDPNEVTFQSDCNDKKQEEDTAVPYLLRNNRSLRLLLNQTKTGESVISPKRRRKEVQ